MSTRLTNSIRETILKKAIARAFDKKEAALEKLKSDFAQKLYSTTFWEYEQAMRALPRGFFKYREQRDISVRTDDGYVYLRKLDLRGEKPFPFLTEEFDLIGEGHPMRYAAMEVIGEMELLKVEQNEFERDCRAILWSVNTVKRLLEVWPEIEDLVPNEPKKSVPIPYDLTIRLNERLGISGGAA